MVSRFELAARTEALELSIKCSFVYLTHNEETRFVFIGTNHERDGCALAFFMGAEQRIGNNHIALAWVERGHPKVHRLLL